ncbi:MAG: Aspartyl/glutamyl-tRNA(Asn/Gln) amidotransferase subunit B [Candidatus Moranbacteria bacterium GW2011_GWF2_36_839]|nr:MAG: Aspartyl/glutamyl-tRNA(Asn/Gln) amidotransferase subunit B [Candidatus Moranbacteria bacterium GW2011_GWF1_36_78]KKQ17580.1 MAG: Aspartyl/glutamyl-tRNA(Asn/Gln) amidotransferase subunit B [Candidatus Moranbacteria bacterium GW2011_GWF2_36_839]HAT74306.1 Asp-tRNA(Asn)/Glu-tRNA(Gln) amidotransferase subunit GatB [Candidatus Moranbacteria bacterium]HBY10916.1 Asp-tRNA(Asn)/Glu-tRNA(Gln) amidotransferase subunit GatB [Candidatus Moranbacteria bacterium]
MKKYTPVIGMEIHVELKTKSKMFCQCKNGLGLEKTPNIDICPVCTAQPGTLPVPNIQAIEFVQLVGLALGCNLRQISKFDRKNYFYPDIPKGYQISQYDQPFCEKGKLKINGKEIGITRIHLEEDTGKLIHPKGVEYTLVDFNRAGVPLMELVTEPDIETGEEARIFCQKLQQICRYLEISDADMEKGNMRCEANISLYKEGEEKLSGTKVEVKNINSFKFVEKAINFEIERQTEMLDKGEKIVQETRGWDANKGETVSQRKKESAHDYRYFPEPDIPPFSFDETYVENIKRKLPELPEQKFERFKKEYDLPIADVEIITCEKELAQYFENVVSEIREKISCKEYVCQEERAIKLAANYMIGELRKHMGEHEHDLSDIKITPENYAEFICILSEGKINSSAAQTVLAEMYKAGGDPSQIIEEKNLAQMDNSDELEKIVEEVLAKNEKSVVDFKAGKENALKFLIGQTMSATKGKANPNAASELLVKKMSGE